MLCIKLHPPNIENAPPLNRSCTPSEPKLHPLNGFLSKLESFARHCKIPKSLKLRDFLCLSMVCGVFVPYIFHRNHTKINVDIHVLTCNFTSKIYDNFLMRF